MRVRLKQPWGQWSKGHLFPDMPGGQARTLIERGIAEEVPEPEEKMADSLFDRALRPGRQRRGGYETR